MSTLLRNAKEYEHGFLFVQDVNGYKFGAFLTEPLKMKLPKFFGTGDTFVF